MKKLLLLPFFLIHVLLFSQPINIVPAPAEIQITEGANFAITKSTVIVLEGSGLENTANFFNDYLQQVYGFKLQLNKAATKNYIGCLRCVSSKHRNIRKVTL